MLSKSDIIKRVRSADNGRVWFVNRFSGEITDALGLQVATLRRHSGVWRELSPAEVLKLNEEPKERRIASHAGYDGNLDRELAVPRNNPPPAIAGLMAPQF